VGGGTHCVTLSRLVPLRLQRAAYNFHSKWRLRAVAGAQPPFLKCPAFCLQLTSALACHRRPQWPFLTDQILLLFIFILSLRSCLLAAAGNGLSVSIMVDGVTKACRFANCAKTSKGLPAMEDRINLHYGAAHMAIAQRAADGKLGLEHLFPHSAAGSSNRSETAMDQSTCATQLHCARASTKGVGALDEHGLIGATCSHVFPVLGSFCDMYTHEQVSVPLHRCLQLISYEYGTCLRLVLVGKHRCWCKSRNVLQAADARPEIAVTRLPVIGATI
jgi:hypothetical protein